MLVFCAASVGGESELSVESSTTQFTTGSTSSGIYSVTMTPKSSWIISVPANPRFEGRVGFSFASNRSGTPSTQSIREANVGLSDRFSRQPNRFVSKEEFETNLERQLAMTPLTLQQLRTYNVTPEKRRRLEFFFYTNTVEKAVALSAELKNKDYEVDHRPSASNAKVQLITGWTAEIAMSDTAVSDWTREMCTLGFKHDCDFDGWGTNAE